MRSASSVRRPRPGQAVTISTANDPLSTVPAMTPYIGKTCASDALSA
jgi:hypothetical protein